MAIQRIEIEPTSGAGDAVAEQTRARMATWLELAPRSVSTRAVYHLDLGLSEADAQTVLAALVDPVGERGVLGGLPDPAVSHWAEVAFKPGVTDTVGASVKRAAEDALGRPLVGRAYASTLFLLDGLTTAQIETAGAKLLSNPVIETCRVGALPRVVDLTVPHAGTDAVVSVATVPLRAASDDALMEISTTGMLSLSLAEMKTIVAHFEGLGRDPTDAELECLAQTWSEHCKHKIFAAPIEFEQDSGEVVEIEAGLFKHFIRGATEAVAASRAASGIDAGSGDFLVSVFHDNAGVVRFTEQDHIVYKVETHNSPSALDPYGGAMTGIVGVNRDSFGTGRGADLLTNVWGYCFARPDFEGRVPAGLMHPRRIRDGVHRGVIDGGNQSGVPYSRGFELFDDRYLGKPLVYCGTAALMPVAAAGIPTHEKPIRVGDHIVVLGGRVGKDGIHGATFSSAQLDENAPVQAVQIGDPITQKMMFDMLAEVRDRGLMSGMTDNGAGGLSSSVGEMAEHTGGARIDLAHAPLKYPGLAPWEILISEAQERMTLAVPDASLAAFLELAERREVEATVLGVFTDSGRFEVVYGDTTAVDLSLEFLHEGWPKAPLRAKLSAPVEVSGPILPEAWTDASQLGARVLELVGSPNLAANEAICRGYDHEVKGLSVVKPWIGRRRDVRSTATVMRARHGRDEGVVLGEGIAPYFSDLDATEMAKACVDEAVRRVLCAGARLDRMAALDNFCWPDPVRSETTPDGEHKLAQLVQCCQGLRASCEAFGVPLVSGKDSMKNDAMLDGVKISIPPTLLVSVVGQMTDVRASLTLQPRSEGDVLWLLGHTRDELGGSEAARAACVFHGQVPRTDLKTYAAAYAAFVSLRDAGRVRTADVCGRGGLAFALSMAVLASGRSLHVDMPAAIDLDPSCWLFSESTGRILFTASPQDTAHVEDALAAHGLLRLGTVGGDETPELVVKGPARCLVQLSEEALRDTYTSREGRD